MIMIFIFNHQLLVILVVFFSFQCVLFCIFGVVFLALLLCFLFELNMEGEMRVFKFSLPLHGFSGRQSPAQGSAPFPRKGLIFTVDVVTFSAFVPLPLEFPCARMCV